MDAVAQLFIESIALTRKQQLLSSQYADDEEESKMGVMKLDLHERYHGTDDCRIFKCFCFCPLKR
jgi:hypothetical protein